MLLVTGANGHFAQAAIENVRQLLGPRERFVVTTRNPSSEAAQNLTAKGIEVRYADFNAPETLGAAMAGIEKILMVSTVGPNTQRFQMHSNALTAAQAAGVRHVIYTSFINASPDAITEHSRLVHYPTEQKIINSGMNYTILRHSVYADAVLDDLEQTLSTGIFTRPGGERAAAHIARDDLAFSAAKVLVGDGHKNRIYTETMAESVTGAQIAALLSEVFEKNIVYRNMPVEDWADYMMHTMGLPEFAARSSVFTLKALEAGEYDLVTSDYETIAGRPPRNFRQFLEDYKSGLK